MSWNWEEQSGVPEYASGKKERYPTSDRVILHCDCDSFFASVESVLDPTLRDVPMAVCGSEEDRRGIVLAKNQLAKKYGIQTAETVWSARRKCRDLVTVPPHHAEYAEFSRRINAIYDRYTDQVEPFSIDESFLDMSGQTDVARQALAIRETVWREVGIPVCVGIGPSKTLAKLANFVAKKHPASGGVFTCNALDTVRKRKLLSGIPACEVWGIGRRLSRTLAGMGIGNAAQLHDADIRMMRARFGVTMERLILELRGVSCLDITQVRPPRQQILSSRSFGVRITRLDDLENAMAFHAAHVGKQLRQEKLVAGMVQVFLETDPYRLDKPQYHPGCCLPFAEPTDSTAEISRYAMAGLHRIYRNGYEYRKGGIWVGELSAADSVVPD